jgi:hypothetical protein
MQDVTRVHRGEADDTSVGNGDERVRIAARAKAGEARRDLGGRRGIAEVSEQIRHRRCVVVARGADVDHFSTGATVVRQIA